MVEAGGIAGRVDHIMGRDCMSREFKNKRDDPRDRFFSAQDPIYVIHSSSTIN